MTIMNEVSPAHSVEIRPAEQLLVIPLPFRLIDGQVLYDLQSRDTLVRYLNSFKTMIVASPKFTESRLAEYSNFVWVPVDELLDRIQFVQLPEVGSKWDFVRAYGPTTRLIRRCIDSAEYLQFAIGGGNGGLEHDWGAVAARQALKMGRKFALLSDAVSYASIKMKADSSHGARRLALRAKEWAVRTWHTGLISRCDLMFCNGRDTFLAYQPYCRSPEIAQKINDFQIGPEKMIDEAGVERKCRLAAERPELHVCYAGRILPQKAPIEWVKAIRTAVDLGASIRATWLGDGSLMEDMRREVEAQGLTGVIDLPGFVSDRDRVIDLIRESDVMMFTHLEPESPRVLIEALMSACPIIGYDRPHPRDLISDHEGGVITPLGDWKALGEALAALAADRTRLVDLIRRAALDGTRFNSEIMNRNRSELIRARVGRHPATAPSPAT
jgi:glycosyltransferase involved in cell wall biosynthesis